MNNPPAFPTFTDPGSREAYCGHLVLGGMTLRDYFAAAALQGMIAGTANPNAMGYPKDNEAGAKAYIYADAMLKAREQ